MDELVCPASSSSSPSSASFFSTAGHHQELEFMPCDVLEGLLGDEDWIDEAPDGVTLGYEGSSARSPGNDLPGEPPAPEPKRRGRRPGPRSDAPVLSHVEAERQRRDRLNRRFCELRAAVPTVSRFDKASLLSDAATYITQLRDRVKQLEAETRRAAMTSAAAAAPAMAATSSLGVQAEELELEVRMVGGEAAALRLTTAVRHRHAPARFMLALRSLDLPVQHACVCLVGGATVQDAVVDVPAGLRDEHGLRAALLHMLQQTGW
ncbi:hypothetical protein SEVIR_6G240200v4 [Setaria viridis]|uniref:Transcription factor n=2 Tax=Setaria TaxID=4554 RepID=K3YLE9_SETIT|nr:transcription factor bHLH14 [Setaria italica]XP_034599271.1 transcription factor bHLH14-like [Setaria viridis]RCV32139.1 hypothetical protein SETIT_6G233900v2 [Setaria italica]RCV32140.1 hypothetical protein SETIT_6G233900v2 [Setaria italica]TKW11562.1 hypothetical protein SEVIR_6G240200v2 [Setaria viridis]